MLGFDDWVHRVYSMQETIDPPVGDCCRKCDLVFSDEDIDNDNWGDESETEEGRVYVRFTHKVCPPMKGEDNE